MCKRDVETIVLAGISTDMGVETTARSAATLGFNVVVAEDATSAPSAEAQRYLTEQIFPFLGRVRSAAEVEAVLAWAGGIAALIDCESFNDENPLL